MVIFIITELMQTSYFSKHDVITKQFIPGKED